MDNYTRMLYRMHKHARLYAACDKAGIDRHSRPVPQYHSTRTRLMAGDVVIAESTSTVEQHLKAGV